MNIFANDSAFGYWLTSASIVKIENCDNSLCATIQIVFVPEGVDPESVLDKNSLVCLSAMCWPLGLDCQKPDTWVQNEAAS